MGWGEYSVSRQTLYHKEESGKMRLNKKGNSDSHRTSHRHKAQNKKMWPSIAAEKMVTPVKDGAMIGNPVRAIFVDVPCTRSN